MGEEGDPKRGSVPSWQLKPSDSPKDAQKGSQETIPDSSPSRTPIIENAQRFLQEDEVRNAPIERQVAFLESKGLERHEIEKFPGVSRNAEASSKAESKDAPDTLQNQVQPSKSLAQALEVTRDVPPIITYPEFLVTPQRPAPLVTAQRLLTTLYLFGGLSALLYGTSHYIITPMVASLTSSRHEFSETAQNNLDRLISQLNGMVSKTPDAVAAAKETSHADEASDSDPTELFHRDIGVQTSIPASPSHPLPLTPSPPLDSTERQGRRLDVLGAHIKDINEAFTSEGQEMSQVSTSMTILREYLDSLSYVAPVYSHGSNGMYGNSSHKNDAIDDEITKVKARIRGVKGVLLSAKSFPGVSRTGRAA